MPAILNDILSYVAMPAMILAVAFATNWLSE